MTTFSIILIILLASFFEAMYDAFKFQLEKFKEREEKPNNYELKKKLFEYGYHFAQAVMMTVLFAMGLLCITGFQFLIAVIAFGLMHAFILDTFFNIFTKKLPWYIGLTAWFDVTWRNLFGLVNEYSIKFKDLTPKQQQNQNFIRFSIYVIKLVFFIIGLILIKELI